jgi:hypothetical protein
MIFGSKGGFVIECHQAVGQRSLRYGANARLVGRTATWRTSCGSRTSPPSPGSEFAVSSLEIGDNAVIRFLCYATSMASRLSPLRLPIALLLLGGVAVGLSPRGRRPRLARAARSRQRLHWLWRIARSFRKGFGGRRDCQRAADRICRGPPVASFDRGRRRPGPAQ